jgi:hypothetical protein
MSLENTNTLTQNNNPPKIIYPDYKYCVWLIPEDRYWYTINRTLTPHMSVKNHMKLSDALNLHSALQKEINHKTIITMVDRNFLISNDDGFTSLEYPLYYSANNATPKPDWWPSDAKMPLLYKYNEGVAEKEKKYMNTYVKRTFVKFGTPCIVSCKGHHREWKFVKV